MGALVKNAEVGFIPGDPGNPGSPYQPAQPARWVSNTVSNCAPSGVPVVKIFDVYPSGPTLFDQINAITGGNGAPGAQILSTYNVDSNNDGQADYARFFIRFSATQSFCTTYTSTQYYPPVPAQPAVPFRPPTPSQVVVSLKQGWNSSARSIGEMLPGHYFEFDVKVSSHAALLALGPPGMDGGGNTSQFKHAILVDTSGVKIVESGVVTPLGAANAPGMKMRIERRADGKIAYKAGTGPTVVRPGAYPALWPLYVYGLLYSAYDEVPSASFGTLAVAGATSPFVQMRGISVLDALAQPLAVLPGASELRAASAAPSVTLPGESALYAEVQRIIVTAGDVDLAGESLLLADASSPARVAYSLPSVLFSAYDPTGAAKINAALMLPAVSVTGDASAPLVPATPTTVYYNLPFLGMGAVTSATDFVSVGYALPSLAMLASEGAYGVAGYDLPNLTILTSEYLGAADALSLFSTAMLQSVLAQAVDLVMVLNSAGRLEGMFTARREHVMALLSAMGQSDSLALSGDFAVSLLSAAGVRSVQSAARGGGAAFDDDSVVWVVNNSTQASSQYDAFSFNSFFEIDGVAFGVAPDGVYRLGGATDAGAAIDALAYLGSIDLGTDSKKLSPAMYLTVQSDEPMQVRLVADGDEYVYPARSYDADAVRQHRVDLGRGLNASMLGVTVENAEGADFKLSSASLLAERSKRRIK